ncbi:MAG: hypothetical protein JXA60_09425 [Candidatus Coatesbacteria bacterium]|nr:hypothetical protein [Candidatus Coatesbacteria bacterium]
MKYIIVFLFILGLSCHPKNIFQKRENPVDSFGRKFTFKYNAPYATQVNLFGNFPFNDDCGKSSFHGRFDLRIYSLKKDDNGIWKYTVNLPKGRYYYHYVVDGQHHILDPLNPEKVNIEGKEYSLLIVY